MSSTSNPQYFLSSERLNPSAPMSSQPPHSSQASENFRNQHHLRAMLSSAGNAAANANTTGTGTTDPSGPVKLIYGTTIDIQESIRLFRDFIVNYTTYHKLEAMAAANNGDGEMGDEGRNIGSILDRELLPEDREPFYPALLRQLHASRTLNVNLDCQNLKAYKPASKLLKQLIRYPQEIIPVMDFVLTEIYCDMFANETSWDEFPGLKVRPFNIGRNVNLRALDPRDIDQLVTIRGLMIRATPIHPDLKEAFFRCQVCDGSVAVKIDRGIIAEPTKCPRPECGAKNTLTLIHNRCIFSDKQVARMQETPDQVPAGQTPYTSTLVFYDDLVDVSKPGDRLEITGIYRAVPVRVNPRQRSIKSLLKTYIDVVHVRKTDKKRLGVDSSIVNDEEFVVNAEEDVALRAVAEAEEREIIELSKRENLYELLSRSVAPSIFGMDDVKKGALLQLFGGTNRISGAKAGSPRVRGDINILLVGDPGVSKSQLLSYVHRIAPRGIYTSGKGSSAVGLTAYVTKDPDTKQLVLESGALVLSDGGICCIDEFDKMSESTRSVLHEVMEQQTVSIAKAGIITTLNARTSILACANPINSKFDPKLSLMSNINLPPTLLSRFDLVYLLLDKPDENDDRRLASHIVSLYISDQPSRSSAADTVKLEMLTKYINYARNKVQPIISEAAGEKLVEFYVRLRHMNSTSSHKSYTATTRQLESLIRLSEAHARMRLSETVDLDDVLEANRLLLTAMQSSAINPATGLIDIDLISTGISALSRQSHSDKVREVRNALGKLVKPGKTANVRSLYRSFVEDAKVKMTEDEFVKAIQECVDLENIIVRGQGAEMKITRIAAEAA